MSEEQTSYKVTDRRLFNPDGTPREVPEDERPEAKPEAPLASAAPATATVEPSVVTQSSSTQTAAAPGREPQNQPTPTERREEAAPQAAESDAGTELPGADDPASFASFMMSIASNAASSLGMMQQKTRGNLLPQEQEILEGLLADLRMQYVSLTNAAPKARSYTSRDITGG